ncbi:oxysterol-binding protein-related protein 9 isoform X2 [Leptidea sinapis]|uniref:oxysterol-binding protein-related protein 9 isoform X2 n=1 Tax=Leptidea sinapis TaxID=189913 RepID=UPI00212406A5|nr:oxysterol-binding protein-related protein 9 isoform X2 [Leptidea sinapis]
MMEGSLSKWTNVMKGWQYRWFVLDENAGLLSYYTSKEKMTRGVRRGCVRLRAAVIGIDDEDDSTFTITVDHKTFHFQARDGSERERWVRALEDTISRHGRRERWSRCVPAPRHGDLERRISEADAYLQIMIELVNKVNTRVTELQDPHERNKGQVILDHSNAMLDNIKHSIVLLQIAKNTVNPVNGVYQGPTTLSQSHIKGQPMSLLVPDTSYSSSEGEEDFYDADEEPNTHTDPAPSGSRACSAASAAEDASPSPGPVDLPRTRDGEIDYDALYEDDSDSDLGSMENHGSVVTHLLSQVKIGMDLTKVVLPTFILERRSLLEMYADSFAHPDQFVKIVDMPTPRERMVQVVRWYLSSYHAGRKSQVAKKPYNPILGEVFRCHWDLDGVEPVTENREEVGDGPVPWCSPDQLSFVAEQVSHHPPISAFYAEHVNKRIQFEAYVWTKSKFLGLSIGVHNIGKGVVTLLDLGEEYTLTFPNGYGRSILTVPWIELGGSVVLECVQTGLRANVEFLTKPFYGGKKHRVTCEVFAGTEKKPFYSAQGEWNSRMEGRWNDTGRTEVVFDVTAMRARRKRVAPISRQPANESRHVWRHVTAALRAADTDAATAAKRRLEQAQRDSAKRRLDNEEAWSTQLFSRKGEDEWEYNTPLRKRIEPKSTPLRAADTETR